MGTGLSPESFAFIASHPGIPGNYPTMYVADDNSTNGGLTRWLYNATTSTWVKSPSTGTGTGTSTVFAAPTTALRGIAAWSDGTNVWLAVSNYSGTTMTLYKDTGATLTSTALTAPTTSNVSYRGFCVAPHL